MIRRFKQVLANERGGVLVFVAVSLGAVLGMSALAVDMGMLYTARSEAQRTADAAALAGASIFLDQNGASAVDPARSLARDYAMRNFVRNTPITDPDIDTIVVNPTTRRVSVTIRRTGVPLWFARILGINTASVAATATAEAVNAGQTDCVKPWALPDNWHDAVNDVNGNRIWDSNESWNFDNANDQTYKAYSGGEPPDPNQTGWAGSYRDGKQNAAGNIYTRDYGRKIEIKATRPQDAPLPGFFYPWRMPNGDGTMNQGADDYRDDIKGCETTPINLGEEYNLEFGNMVGPTNQATESDKVNGQDTIPSLINQDPGARWDPTLNGGKGGVAGSKFANWRDSPRVATVAVFDPGQVKTIRGGNQGGQQGQATIKFNNFALLFIEGQPKQQDPVTARFLYYVQGTGTPGPTTGGLVRAIRLVQ